MICPYNQIFQYTEQTNILNEENPEWVKKHVIATIYKNMECQKENCAVWRNNKCCYNK